MLGVPKKEIANDGNLLPAYLLSLFFTDVLSVVFFVPLLLYGLGVFAALRSPACQRFHPFLPVPLPVPPLPLVNLSLRQLIYYDLVLSIIVTD